MISKKECAAIERAIRQLNLPISTTFVPRAEAEDGAMFVSRGAKHYCTTGDAAWKACITLNSASAAHVAWHADTRTGVFYPTADTQQLTWMLEDYIQACYYPLLNTI